MTELFFIGGVLVGIVFVLAFQKFYTKVVPKEIKEKIEVAVCNHEYRLIDNWSSDALGVPYGYKTYECTKCKHKDKKFWYV